MKNRQNLPLALLAVSALFLASSPVFAELPKPEFSGFADFYTASRAGDLVSSGFQFGQVEFDLEAPLAQRIDLEAGMAYDPESRLFGIASFLVDFDLFDKNLSHTHRMMGIDHSGFIVGQFDVPFGLDWQVYPSIDRKLISTPLVIEHTHGIWNDAGVQLYVDHSLFNATVYATNGIPYTEAIDTTGGGNRFLGYNEFGYDPEDPRIVRFEEQSHLATGSRIGITVIPHVELGGSWAGFIDENHKMSMTLTGADLQVRLAGLYVKGEFISHVLGLNNTHRRDNTGMYLQGLYDFGPVYAVARAGRFNPDSNGTSDLGRLSLGAGWKFIETSELRFEYQLNEGSADDILYLQLAVSF